jgi:hypothetical protein
MIATPALGIEPATLRDRFEQRGLPTTVFADQERDLAPKLEIDPTGERADIEGMRRSIDCLWQAGDSMEEGRATRSP